jgi:hypothetical protein
MSNDDETAGLDSEIAALLADPSMWVEPSADLEDRVAADIAAEPRSWALPRLSVSCWR